MRNSLFRLTPNQSRVLYDFVVSLLTALAAAAYVLVFLGHSFAPGIVAAPVLVIAGHAALGIYSRFKVAPGALKAVLGTIAVLASGGVLLALTSDTALVVLWMGLVLGPLLLPRIFLNLNTRVPSTLVRTAMRDRGPVLVTGGAGYIGTHVIEQLLASGRSVRILDRLMFGREALRDFIGNPRFELVEGDATEVTKLIQAMDGASAVVHLAGLVGDPACAVDEAFTRHANVVATRMIKEVAISLGVGRFVFASSCSVYGVNEDEVDEQSPARPVSLYAQTKVDSERELLLCPHENFYVTVLRFATVFGHSRRPRFDLVANLFAAQAIRDGKILLLGPAQWRPFIHVRDLARAVVMVLDAPAERMRGHVFNVGDERLNMTIGDLADRVRRTIGRTRPVEVVHGETLAELRNYRVSFKKIRGALGFEAATLLEAGIEEIAAEFERGSFANYRDPSYSNVATTQRVLSEFHDPDRAQSLWHPLGEPGLTRGTPKQ